MREPKIEEPLKNKRESGCFRFIEKTAHPRFIEEPKIEEPLKNKCACGCFRFLAKFFLRQAFRPSLTLIVLGERLAGILHLLRSAGGGLRPPPGVQFFAPQKETAQVSACGRLLRRGSTLGGRFFYGADDFSPFFQKFSLFLNFFPVSFPVLTKSRLYYL